MRSAEYWITHLQLHPHPEGGFYREVYRSTGNINRSSLSGNFSGDRSFATSIYFLLRSGEVSAFHRIKSDELWFFHEGSPLTVYYFEEGKLNKIQLGSGKDQALQSYVPANTWFGAAVDEAESYSLVSCVVAPGFDFNDFELGRRKDLLLNFPEHAALIHRFCNK